MTMNAVPNDPPTVAGGGEPPYDKDMDRRLTVLETRFDTILPALATKGDLEALRAEFRGDSEKQRGEFEKLRGEFEKLRGEFEKLRGEFEKFRDEVLCALEKSRADMLKALNDAMKWIMALALTTIISMFGMGFAMLNAVNNVLAAKQSASATVQADPGRAAAPLLPPKADRATRP